MDRLAPSLLQLFQHLSAASGEVVPAPAWQRHFAAHGLAGTFVLLEPMRARYRVLDAGRSRRRFLPGATFDIANALVGLERGSIADENARFAWDGRPKPFPAWERDQTLASAMAGDVAWTFQEVARRTGRPAMGEWLERLEYGNADMAGGIERFWLQGALRISAMEQVRFLHRLSEGRLPMTQRAQRLVRQALVVDRTRARTLYAKAAQAAGGGRDAASWWVGWIERRGRPEAHFAMNLAATPRGGAQACARIGRAVLREAGVL